MKFKHIAQYRKNVFTGRKITSNEKKDMEFDSLLRDLLDFSVFLSIL